MANQASTTDLIQLQEIRDGIIILKDHSLRAIVEVGAINFELRSSEEQEAIIQQFQSFLNSIDFPVQMIVHSRKFDITAYLATVQTAADQLTNELLKSQAGEYMRFIKELSDLSNIMSKKFYIALPFDIVTSPTGSGGWLSKITGIFKKKKGTPAPTGPTPEQIIAYKSQLQQRADLVSGGLSGMGLKGHMMTQEELLPLFHDVYNPVVPAVTVPPTP